MKFEVAKSKISGEVFIPGSKSHTIRALFFALLANGESKIFNPLESDDAISAFNTVLHFGAKVEKEDKHYIVQGVNGKLRLPDDVINVGNSGTTLRIAISLASLIDGWTVFTGDHQIRNRVLEPLILALNNFGATVVSTRNNYKAPILVKGIARGGKTDLDAVTSQFLTSLLISCPLMEKDTVIKITRLNEQPYVDMTLWWLDKFGIKYENNSYKEFFIKGGQSYKSFSETIPGDFSSATFFLVLASINKSKIKLYNLDMSDVQGDKRVIEILKEMGAKIEINDKEKSVTIEGGDLKGIEIDMNDIPDALPALAVAGCFARGETKLLNVYQARLKETDRIKVMATELTKMGARITELEDGLIIKESKLMSANVNGHFDHRVVMALTIAGLNVEGKTIVDTAEAASVTFPEFADYIKKCNGNLNVIVD
ncbi:MAG TPA: 3-phosphoshikimate 1-carboxyvinyltransferase [Spirochaetota bacterium]|nr:3-phosphoshikimate 1-carboxyvinyltransferase [Spirochaetota bacterium]HOL57831.1 3-phosphoshikimate 1-carboxyvinyltransferase [Spirochaetota bacterium]HPP05399.1 3-phosphoshikimate 1-carboxyvinyltransferase [Spirochaetota bacterium]